MKELSLAIDQLRLRRPDDPWLIPVRFDDCNIPDLELGVGRTLASIQRADLFGASRDMGSVFFPRASHGRRNHGGHSPAVGKAPLTSRGRAASMAWPR